MVELVIKIDENVITRLFDNGIQDNEIAVDDICEMARALRMGTPLEEKLENIKTEFEEDKYILLNQTVAIQIMDKHIAELKGGE